MPNHIRFEETETHFKLWVEKQLLFNVYKDALKILHYGGWETYSPFRKFLIGVEEVTPVMFLNWIEQLYEEGKLIDEPETI